MPTKTIVLLLVAYFSSALANAVPINVDFGTHYRNEVFRQLIATPVDTYRAASGQAGTWNNVNSLGTTSALLDLTGTATLASVTLIGSNFGSGVTGGTDAPLLQDMLWRSSGRWEVNFSDLSNGLYDIYYYAPTHPMDTGVIDINGTMVSSLPGTAPSTLIQGVSWDVLVGVAVTDGTLNLSSGAASASFNGIAGIQIVTSTAVPEPSTLGLLGAGLLGLMLQRKHAAWGEPT